MVVSADSLTPSDSSRILLTMRLYATRTSIMFDEYCWSIIKLRPRCSLILHYKNREMSKYWIWWKSEQQKLLWGQSLHLQKHLSLHVPTQKLYNCMGHYTCKRNIKWILTHPIHRKLWKENLMRILCTTTKKSRIKRVENFRDWISQSLRQSARSTELSSFAKHNM